MNHRLFFSDSGGYTSPLCSLDDVIDRKINCIYYQQGKSELYFCPGIGSIKEIHYGKSRICKVELIEYDLL